MAKANKKQFRYPLAEANGNEGGFSLKECLKECTNGELIKNQKMEPVTICDHLFKIKK